VAFPSIDELRKHFRLDPQSGLLYRLKKGRGGWRVGDVAGYISPESGYWVVGHNYREYRGHCIVFALTHGRWQEAGKQIDHINGDRADNRPENLREVTIQQNRWNSARHVRTTSGVKGVYPTRGGKWCSKIMKDRVNYNLGTFATPEEAKAAHDEAARRLHGEYARLEP
jgi:hypothetical protein